MNKRSNVCPVERRDPHGRSHFPGKGLRRRRGRRALRKGARRAAAGLYDLAELYKIFGDTTRVKILYALFESELCVNDIAQCLSMTPSAVSHQLRILKANKLVRFRREGKTVFYGLDDDHVRDIIALGLEHIAE